MENAKIKNREIVSDFSGHGRFYGEIYKNFILELIPIENYIHEGSFNKVPLEYYISVSYIPKGRKKPKILLGRYSKSGSPKRAVKKGQKIIDNLSF